MIGGYKIQNLFVFLESIKKKKNPKKTKNSSVSKSKFW